MSLAGGALIGPNAESDGRVGELHLGKERNVGRAAWNDHMPDRAIDGEVVGVAGKPVLPVRRRATPPVLHEALEPIFYAGCVLGCPADRRQDRSGKDKSSGDHRRHE
ncbi:MAG: hypothetical protein H0V36_11235 [Chloroflexi bacterium]|nr:hypothetical protein [Chloroflexota bacterium]